MAVKLLRRERSSSRGRYAAHLPESPANNFRFSSQPWSRRWLSHAVRASTHAPLAANAATIRESKAALEDVFKASTHMQKSSSARSYDAQRSSRSSHFILAEGVQFQCLSAEYHKRRIGRSRNRHQRRSVLRDRRARRGVQAAIRSEHQRARPEVQPENLISFPVKRGHSFLVNFGPQCPSHRSRSKKPDPPYGSGFLNFQGAVSNQGEPSRPRFPQT